MRFLLTVSPVPLTATASGQHVLTATTYSKSVLRSAAGYLAQIRDDTDYFPSYELITAPAFKGQFFEPNMRSVSSEGVAFVMGQFFAAIGVATPATPEISGGTKAVGSNNAERTESGTDICDDIILETWSNKPVDDAEEPPNILLIGDSQMGMIAKVLDEQRIRYAGGAIMHGSEWHSLQFTLLEDIPYFVPTIAEARSRWEKACSQSLLKVPKSARSNMWIFTNIGLHSNQILSTNGLGSYIQAKYGQTTHTGHTRAILVQDLHEYLNSARASHLSIVSKFGKAGFKTIWISDPPVDRMNDSVMDTIGQILSEKFSATDCLPFLAKKWVSDEYGTLPAEFLSSEIDPSTGQPDIIHGSLEYYRQLIKEIFHEFKIQPQYRQTV